MRIAALLMMLAAAGLPRISDALQPPVWTNYGCFMPGQAALTAAQRQAFLPQSLPEDLRPLAPDGKSRTRISLKGGRWDVVVYAAIRKGNPLLSESDSKLFLELAKFSLDEAGLQPREVRLATPVTNDPDNESEAAVCVGSEAYVMVLLRSAG